MDCRHVSQMQKWISRKKRIMEARWGLNIIHIWQGLLAILTSQPLEKLHNVQTVGEPGRSFTFWSSSKKKRWMSVSMSFTTVSLWQRGLFCQKKNTFRPTLLLPWTTSTTADWRRLSRKDRAEYLSTKNYDPPSVDHVSGWRCRQLHHTAPPLIYTASNLMCCKS